jgi:hypothetical protein
MSKLEELETALVKVPADDRPWRVEREGQWTNEIITADGSAVVAENCGDNHATLITVAVNNLHALLAVARAAQAATAPVTTLAVETQRAADEKGKADSEHVSVWMPVGALRALSRALRDLEVT